MDPPGSSAHPPRAALLTAAVVAPFFSGALLFAGAHWAWALLPLVGSHLLLLYATLVPGCQWWGPIYQSFVTDAREVWITIDDGPSPAHTLQMLELLQRADARATFFVIGELAEKHPHLITEILTRGHAVANHTQTHPARSFWCAGPRRVRREIARCAEHLRTNETRPAHFFRAPAGLRNMFLHPLLAQRGLGLVGWSARGFDTVARDPARVVSRIEKAARPGAIILLHEGRQTARDPEFGLRCLELTLQRLTARGFRCVLPRPEQLRTNPPA